MTCCGKVAAAAPPAGLCEVFFVFEGLTFQSRGRARSISWRAESSRSALNSNVSAKSSCSPSSSGTACRLLQINLQKSHNNFEKSVIIPGFQGSFPDIQLYSKHFTLCPCFFLSLPVLRVIPDFWGFPYILVFPDLAFVLSSTFIAYLTPDTEKLISCFSLCQSFDCFI